MIELELEFQDPLLQIPGCSLYQVFSAVRGGSQYPILQLLRTLDRVYHDSVYYMLRQKFKHLIYFENKNPFYVNIFVGKYFPDFLSERKEYCFHFL